MFISFRKAGRPETYGLDMKKIQLLPKAEELQNSLKNHNSGKKIPIGKKEEKGEVKATHLHEEEEDFFGFGFWSM